MVRGISSSAFRFATTDAALDFYTETMGFKVVTDQPFTPTQRWIELMIPGSETGLALFTPEGHESRIGQFQSIAFWCDDVFATAKALKAKGVKFTQGAKERGLGSNRVFQDPTGITFALSSKGKAK